MTAPAVPDCITVAWLTRRRACADQVAAFARVFPMGTHVTLAAVQRAEAAGLNLDWVLTQLPAPAWGEYERVRTAAWAKYMRVTAPARAVYDRAKTRARAKYIGVTAPAWGEHIRVMAAAWAKYDRATAPALAKYERARTAAVVAAWKRARR